MEISTRVHWEVAEPWDNHIWWRQLHVGISNVLELEFVRRQTVSRMQSLAQAQQLPLESAGLQPLAGPQPLVRAPELLENGDYYLYDLDTMSQQRMRTFPEGDVIVRARPIRRVLVTELFLSQPLVSVIAE